MQAQIQQFNRANGPWFLWCALYGLVWLTFVVGGDVRVLVLAAAFAAIMLWKHWTRALLMLAALGVAALLFLALDLRWPELVFVFLVVGAWVL